MIAVAMDMHKHHMIFYFQKLEKKGGLEPVLGKFNLFNAHNQRK